MKIVTVARCFNEENNIDRFMKAYSFADKIIISDGGSTDRSLEILKWYETEWAGQVKLIHFENQKTVNGQLWNDDNPHLNYVINAGKAETPDWIILDDMDDVPNFLLRENARRILEETQESQIHAFRLYLWGNDQYFPLMNNFLADDWQSLWAWQPKLTDIHADNTQHHGTIVGIDGNARKLKTPYCLLHKSWHPDTIQRKMDRYNAVGIEMRHPLNFAGTPQPLPDWAEEYE